MVKVKTEGNVISKEPDRSKSSDGRDSKSTKNESFADSALRILKQQLSVMENQSGE